MASLTSFEYSLELINSKKAIYTLLTRWIILLNVVSIGYLAFTTTEATTRKQLIVFGLLLPMINLLLERFFKKSYLLPYSLGTILFWFCAAWWLAGYHSIAALNLLFLFLFLATTRKLLVRLGATGVRYPSLPAKLLPWNSLNQVILKDGLLTIDKKDNTLIQQYITESSLTDETDFNSYCQSHLKND